MTEKEFDEVVEALKILNEKFYLGMPCEGDFDSLDKVTDAEEIQRTPMTERWDFYSDDENGCTFSPEELVALAASPPSIEYDQEEAMFFTDTECCICVQEVNLVASIDYLILLKAEIGDEWSICLTNESKLKVLGVGLHLFKHFRRKDVFQSGLAIEIVRKKGTATKEEMLEAARAFIFELATTHGVLVSPFAPRSVYDSWDEEDDLVAPLEAKKFKPLINSAEAIELFLNAEWAVGQEEELLGYYKVLENFGPSVAKLDAHEKLAHLLADPRALSPDKAILDNILDVTSAHKNPKDSFLIRLVIQKCCSLHVLSNYPDLEALYRDFQDSQTIKNLAGAFYDTRNEVVHAKANYRSRGGEIPAEYRKDAVKLLRSFAEQVIRWSSRLPHHLQ